MAKRLTITIDDDLAAYLDETAVDNRSAFISDVLRKHQKAEIKALIIQGLQEDAADPEYLAEVAEWDNANLELDEPDDEAV